MDDIIRRAAELKRQQEALAAELSALGEDVDINANAGTSALDPALLRLLESDPSRSLELPPGVLRTELERLLGLRPDAAALDPLANGIQYEECEAMARAIEETGMMPSPPPDMFTSPPEPAESFLARLNGSIEDFEKFLQTSRKDRARLKREFAAGIAAGDDTGPPKAKENEPPSAGGEEGGDGFADGHEDDDDDDAEDDADDNFSLFDQELTESIPAPEIPVEALEAAHRAHRVLLVLRRIFVDQTDVKPLAFLEALSHRDLLAPDFVFSDPWINLTRAEEAWRYLTRMNETGAEIDFDVMFLGFDEYEPKVKGRVVAHTLFRMPLPHWCLKYLCIHGLSDLPEESDEGPRRRKGEPLRIWREGDGPAGSPPGCEMYPRHADGTSHDDDDSMRHSEARGHSHVPWLCMPFPLAAQRQALVRNDDCIVEYAVEEDDNTDEDENDVLIVGWGNNEWSTNDSNISKPHRVETVQRIFPDYSALPSVHSMLVDPVRASFGNGAWYAGSLEDSQPSLPPLPRPRPASLEEDPLNPDEAEQLLRELLGNKKFEEIACRLPPKAPPVTGPAIPDHLCFGATWSFDVHPDTGKVCNISLSWSWVGGPFCDERDAYDVWIAETGLLEDYEDALT